MLCGLNYQTEITSDVITLGAGGDAVPPLAGETGFRKGQRNVRETLDPRVKLHLFSLIAIPLTAPAI